MKNIIEKIITAGINFVFFLALGLIGCGEDLSKDEPKEPAIIGIETTLKWENIRIDFWCKEDGEQFPEDCSTSGQIMIHSYIGPNSKNIQIVGLDQLNIDNINIISSIEQSEMDNINGYLTFDYNVTPEEILFGNNSPSWWAQSDDLRYQDNGQFSYKLQNEYSQNGQLGLVVREYNVFIIDNETGVVSEMITLDITFNLSAILIERYSDKP